MSPEEIQIATRDALIVMRKNVNKWSVRNSLCELTEFGFWQGKVFVAFVALDNDTAYQIIDAALTEVNGGHKQVIDGIYGVVYHFEIMYRKG